MTRVPVFISAHFSRRRPPERAVELWDKACKLNDARACANIGASYIAVMGVAQDLAAAGRFLLNACFNGISEACSNMAMLLSHSDDQNAKALLKQMLLSSCLLGRVDSCKKIGAEAPKKSIDDQKALGIRCHEGDAKACFAAGVNLQEAIAPIDFSVAARIPRFKADYKLVETVIDDLWKRRARGSI